MFKNVLVFIANDVIVMMLKCFSFSRMTTLVEGERRFDCCFVAFLFPLDAFEMLRHFILATGLML